MKIWPIHSFILVAWFFLVGVGCTGGGTTALESTVDDHVAASDTMTALPLSDSTARKLNAPLRRLLNGAPSSSDLLQTDTRNDSTTVYAVLIETSNPDALRKANLPLGSVHGSFATARWTREEIHTAVQMEAVQRITHARPHEPH